MIGFKPCSSSASFTFFGLIKLGSSMGISTASVTIDLIFGNNDTVSVLKGEVHNQVLTPKLMSKLINLFNSHNTIHNSPVTGNCTDIGIVTGFTRCCEHQALATLRIYQSRGYNHLRH